jgi:hypothetical protein
MADAAELDRAADVAAILQQEKDDDEAAPGSHDCSMEHVDAVLGLGDLDIEEMMLSDTDVEVDKSRHDDGYTSKEKVRFYFSP